jgi:cytochrome c oxidase subunit III
MAQSPADYQIGVGDPGRRGSSRRASFTGVCLLLAAVLMFFAAFTSAFLVRRASSEDWGRLPLPALVWWNSAALLASSFALELARRALRSGRRIAFNRLWTAGTVLGLAFLVGQLFVWTQLQNAGIYVATTPSSSFFYVLTVAHAAHLLGGIAALVYVDVQALRLQLGPAKRTAADASTVYWHFMDGIWLFLLALFIYWG